MGLWMHPADRQSKWRRTFGAVSGDDCFRHHVHHKIAPKGTVSPPPPLVCVELPIKAHIIT